MVLISISNFPSHYTSSSLVLDGKTWSQDAPPLTIIAQIHNNKTGIPTVAHLAHDDVSFSDSYLRQHTVCQPTHFYHWRFSSLLLLVLSLLTLIYAATLTALHGDAFWHGRTDRLKYDINHYKDAAVLVQELESRHIQMQQLSGAELTQEVKQINGGVIVDHDDLPPTRQDEWNGLRQKKRKERLLNPNRRQRTADNLLRFWLGSEEMQSKREHAMLQFSPQESTVRQKSSTSSADIA